MPCLSGCRDMLLQAHPEWQHVSAAIAGQNCDVLLLLLLGWPLTGPCSAGLPGKPEAVDPMDTPAPPDTWWLLAVADDPGLDLLVLLRVPGAVEPLCRLEGGKRLHCWRLRRRW
jgi:hypothetical protein